MADRVVVAFLLTFLAAGCTCLGASVAFFAKLTNRKFLAASLGGAAGVMMFISLVEIYPKKAVHDFGEHLKSSPSDPRPFRYATFCFFGGLVVVYLLDCFTHWIMELGCKDDMPGPQPGVETEAAAKDVDLESATIASSDSELDAVLSVMPKEHRRALTKMGLLNMLAIGLHNLPEGLVTFVGYYHNPSAGIALAIAVALHNIPEGVVVGMPIYFATGSRMQAMLWTAVSGSFEAVGGLVGYFVVVNGRNSPISNAIMFGLVSGIMVYISVKDLLPTALKYDPDDKVTTTSFIGGACVMAASLLLLAL